MSKPKNVWQQVKDIVEAGQCPEINLSPDQQVRRIKKSGPGRPANLPEEQNFNHYLGRGKLKSHPRCYRRGCFKRLRVDQPLCCSEECTTKVIEEAYWVLSVTGQRDARLVAMNFEALPDPLKEKMKNAKSRNRRSSRG